MRELAVVRSSERIEDFYVREFPAVVRFAAVLSGSRWAAEDLAQEAFLAAHRDWEWIGAYDRPGAWVRRVVANLGVGRASPRRSFGRSALRLSTAS